MAAIVEYSGDAIISGTLAGTITSWNPAATRMFGYSSGEIVGKPITLLVAQDRTGEITSILARINAGHTVEHHETTGVRKDGTPIRVSLTAAPVRGTDDAVIALSLIARDLPEQT